MSQSGNSGLRGEVYILDHQPGGRFCMLGEGPYQALPVVKLSWSDQNCILAGRGREAWFYDTLHT